MMLELTPQLQEVEADWMEPYTKLREDKRGTVLFPHSGKEIDPPPPQKVSEPKMNSCPPS